MIKGMPDPPATDLVSTPTSEPSAKKQKVASDELAKDKEGDWETVERSALSAYNGNEGDSQRAEGMSDSVMGTEMAKEDMGRAVHITEAGGDAPKNMLGGDW